ncbi:uncharacterized protein [Eurosta solidaginis]|uniref:uncharacterized protein n=1 Tax=Eurosta solidaginis TaxID=178769 RepID=UPI0035306B5B
MRLHKALQGAAKRAITSLLIYPEDVPRVIQELEFKFGRPELLIKAQLQKVQRFQPINENHLDQILDFSNRVRNIIAFFKSARCSHHLMNPTLLECLVGKLPPSKQYEWSQRAATIVPFPTVENFGEWLSEIAKVVSLLPGVSDVSLRTIQANVSQSTSTAQSRTVTRHNGSATNSTRRVLYNNEVQSETKGTCIKCGQSHKLEDCRQFLSGDIPTKWSFVKNNRLCFGCLRKGHSLGNCRQRKECSYNGCKRMHHKLLHLDASQLAPTPEEVQRVLNCHDDKQSTLFKILPITLSGPNGSISVYAMFDEGSSITLLEENVANTLGLRGQTIPLTLQWYGESQVKENSRKVSVTIKGSYAEYNIKNVHTVRSLNLPIQSFEKEKFAHLQSLPVTSYYNAKPVVLLGLDNSYLGISNKTVDAGPNKPMAIATQLGWVVYGPLKQSQEMHPRVLHVHKKQSLQELHKLVSEYYSVDSFGICRTNIILESDDNRRARVILEETTKELDQKYEVGLLWRSDHTTLPFSFDMAYQRLRNLESRMSKDSNFNTRYRSEIEKYVQKGYARLLSRDKVAQTSPTTWYLPHFGVVNPHKPNKLRIVFDAAAATSNVSLNSALLKGPEHAQSLIAVIYKFRQGSVAVAADIQEIFSQVAIRDVDQNSQRFLWRDGDSSEPVRVYVMQSMIFGAVCSPCCAEYIKNLNANKYESVMPRGATVVVNNMYVDDLVVSFANSVEAEEVVREVIYINSAAGFKLRNFVSNDKSLQIKLGRESDTSVTYVDMEHKSAADKVLGMFWNTLNDTFEFHVKFHKISRDVLNCKRPPTKR